MRKINQVRFWWFSVSFLVVFGVLATTFCPSAIRNALSASGAVRVRDVMFNRNQKNDR